MKGEGVSRKKIMLITGSWESTIVVCGNHPDKADLPIMNIASGGSHSLRYVCPKNNPLNRDEDEPCCENQLSLQDYEKILDHIAKVFEDAELNGEKPYLLYHKWKHKTHQYEIIEHSRDRIVVKYTEITKKR